MNIVSEHIRIALKLVENEIEKYESLLKQVRGNIDTFPEMARSERQRKIYEVESYLRNLRDMRTSYQESLGINKELVGGLSS